MENSISTTLVDEFNVTGYESHDQEMVVPWSLSSIAQLQQLSETVDQDSFILGSDDWSLLLVWAQWAYTRYENNGTPGRFLTFIILQWMMLDAQARFNLVYLWLWYEFPNIELKCIAVFAAILWAEALFRI